MNLECVPMRTLEQHLPRTHKYGGHEPRHAPPNDEQQDAVQTLEDNHGQSSSSNMMRRTLAGYHAPPLRVVLPVAFSAAAMSV